MMKHRSTIAIFGEWQRLAFDHKSGFSIPQRENIKPSRLGRHLSDLFLVELDDKDEMVFRLGGTDICTLFGRELKGQRLLSLWPERDRPAIYELSQNVRDMHIPALSHHKGVSLSGRSLNFEMLLAPLKSRSGQMNLLGSIAVLDTVSWIGADPLVFGHLDTIEPIAPDMALEEKAPKTAMLASHAAPRNQLRSQPRVKLAKSAPTPPYLRVIHGGKSGETCEV